MKSGQVKKKYFLRASIRYRLYSLYYRVFIYGRCFLILSICLWCGNFISLALPIKIPGSIIGMLILFVLFTLQIIPTRWVHRGCNFMMRYMILLFIPAAMGIMDNYTYLISSWVPILVSSIISTFITMLSIGFLVQYFESRKQRLIDEKHNQQDGK